LPSPSCARDLWRKSTAVSTAIPYLSLLPAAWQQPPKRPLLGLLEKHGLLHRAIGRKLSSLHSLFFKIAHIS
jgi:hypothetical protein